MLYLLVRWLEDWLVTHDLYRFARVLDQTEFRALAAAAISFAIVLALGRRTIAWLRRKKIGDAGLSDAEALRRHSAGKANTPTMGGVLVAGAIAGSVLLLADLSQFYVQVGLVVIAWLTALGGMDDWLKLTSASRGAASRQGLYAWEKLVFQIGLGVLVGYFVYTHGDAEGARDLPHVLNLPFQRTYQPGGMAISPGLVFLSRGAFIAWAALLVAGMSNAVNITDGMDGLAAGISAAVALGLGILALIAGELGWAQHLLVPHIPFAGELAILAGAMAGACLGFLWWNCLPAQVFMGDTGALCLGGLLAYVALVIRQEAVTLLMGAVFLTEIGSVALQVAYFRGTGGKRLFRCAPYHHHLHLLGWTEQQVVARAWIVSILLVVAALASVKMR